MKKSFWRKSISLLVVSSLLLGSISVYSGQVVTIQAEQTEESADALFEQLQQEYLSNMPAGQSQVSYTQNYQSNEPENIIFKKGSGKGTVNNGLTVDLEGLTNNQAVGIMEKSPWLSSGIVDVTFSYVSESERIGFLFKADDDRAGIAVKYDVTRSDDNTLGTWVIQDPDNGSLWKSFVGPALEQDKRYRLRFGYHQDKLIIALDDLVIFNENTSIISEEWKDSLGQIGFFKWYQTPGTIKINNLNITGVGSSERPSAEKYNYEYDFEETANAYDIDWIGANGTVTAAIVADDMNSNHVLEVKSTNDQRTVDLNSPMIAEGSLSFDYKLTRGEKFSFLFRVTDDISEFCELAYDGSRWVAESNLGYSDSLDIPQPQSGKWNNMLINFQGKDMTVYLNKELIGVINFEQFTTQAGHWGLRLRNAEMQIDNIRYTDKIIGPDVVQEYVNDFEDRVIGHWETGTGTIAQEGSNRILKLSGVTMNGSLNTDSIDLTQGTYFVSMKSASDQLGVRIGDALIYYNGTDWIAKVNGTEIVIEGELGKPINNVWNHLGVQFTSSTLDFSINGKNARVNLGNTGLAGGKLGIVAEEDVYVDDITYTEKFLDFVTEANEDKIVYEEYYDTVSSIDYNGLIDGVISDGTLKGEIPAGVTAINNHIAEIEHVVYQVKMKSDSSKTGIQMGNTLIYHKGNGNWEIKVNNGTPIPFSGPDLQANADTIIRAEMVEKELVLSINHAYIGKWQLSTYSKDGGLGIYNAGNANQQVSIDAMTAEEIRVYKQDYNTSYTPDWTISDGSVVWNTDGTLSVNAPGAVQLIDNESLSLNNKLFSVDFKPSVDDGLDTGGRYGVYLKYVSNEDYVSVECDVNGKWRVNAKGSEYNFPVTYSMNKNTTYRIDARLEDKSVSLSITDPNGNVTDLGSVSAEEITNTPGKFGIKSWWGHKTITLDNLKIVEIPTIKPLNVDEVLDEIQASGLTVTLDSQFPRLVSYTLGGKTMLGQETQLNTVLLNGQKVTPITTGNKVSNNSYEYVLNFTEADVIIKIAVTVKDNHVVRFEVTDIIENGSYKVRTFGLGENALLYADTTMETASYAWTTANGEWHGLTEERKDSMSDMTVGGQSGTTMTMISGNGLAGSVENNVMSGGNKVIFKKEIKSLVNKARVFNGVWTYRHELSDTTEKLPWMEIVITEDRNDDGKVDWQDAAVAYRDAILVRPFEADDMANNMMYIAFNFASQANDPFLNTLDTGKVLYNYTDGFGQMVLHKGYQAEGHDDSIPSYSNVGVRQGGIEDFNYLIDEGANYNMKIGVHLNATEYHLDANELYYDNLNNATSNGYKRDSLLGGWDWIDTSYYVDQTKDVITGQLQERFEGLYNLTKDSENPDDPAVDFYYIDVYTGNDYNAYKLLEFANDLGIKVGTEFAGPLEPGANFVHWGPDLGYPNKGNGSILYRMVKNDLDIFVGNALFKGQKIPVVSYWGDSKMDIEQGVYVFNNEVLPTKFMQHYGVLKYEDDRVTFSDNVVSARNHQTGKIELTKDGKLISSWVDSGTTTDQGVRHTGEATSLIPWEWDVKTGESLGLNEGAKLYHWNPSGGTTTWDLTDKFSDVSSFKLYQLTQQGKELVRTINTTNGTITIDAVKNTPYVLYPNNVAAEDIVPTAANWGEGSLIKDFAFNSESLNQANDSWKATSNVTIETVAGRNVYNTSKELTENRWNKYAKIGTGEGNLSQEFDGLEPGQDYTVSVWTNVTNGRRSTLEVEIGGETYTNYVTGKDGNHKTNFKYRNTTWQRVFVEFKVPDNVTEAKVLLKANGGTGSVQFDDVKIWKHLTTEEDVNNTSYVTYEDFENTSEGWGIFEYEEGDLQVHIASYQDNPNNVNELAAAGEGKVGPVLTWVLDGNNSLKINETTVGRVVKTNEAGLKFNPNTDYRLSFLYTMESNVRWKVEVKSRSTGEVLFIDNLRKVANSGNKTSAETYSKTFKTGSKDDYQVVFTLIGMDASSPKSNSCALILDNFGVELVNK